MDHRLGGEDRHRCEIRPAAMGKGVFATEPIPAGTGAVILPAVFDDRPGRHTIQLGAGQHQAYTGHVDDFLNHSCRPSTFLDPEGLRLVALHPIGAGEEVTFNYSASELDMAEPFECLCEGTPRLVRGFRHMSPTERDQIAHLVPAWLWALRHAI
jgi:hypothetical protein